MSTSAHTPPPVDARAFWVVAPGYGEIRTGRLPGRGPHELLVRTVYSAVSRGTEALVFEGHVPATEYDRMRAPFQEGRLPGPVKYGYINVGVVEEGPDTMVGKRVFSLSPHQDWFVIPSEAVRPIPASVPSGRAVLAANLETAINGVWDAGVQVGDRVAVVGAGVVGCLVAWLVQASRGVSCTLVDIDPGRAPVAERLGVRFALPSAAGDDFDGVIHTSGAGAGLSTALSMAGDDTTIVDMSWYGDRPVSLALGGAFHARRLTIKSSQVGALPPARRTRWTLARRLDLALGLLDDPTLDVLITGESAFEDLPEVMPRLAATGSGALCHRIRY